METFTRNGRESARWLFRLCMRMRRAWEEELELRGIEVNDATPSTNDAEAWGVPERETRASSRKLDVCSISSRTIPCS